MPSRHYVVMIVVDAGRTNYFDLPHLPHIHALMHNGVVYTHAWVGQLNSSTPDVHVTLGTGTLPRENGFMGFGWVDPVTRRTVDFRTLLANHAIDPVLKSLPVPSIATRLHQFFPSAKSVAVSGHKDYAAVGLGGGTADYVLHGKFTTTQFVPRFLHGPPPLTAAERDQLTVPQPLPRGGEDSWAFNYASMVAKHVRPRLLMINLPEMDTWGHWDGPNSPALVGLVHNVDRGIGQIERTYRQLGIFNRTDFIITADHGMMQSIPSRNWVPIENAAAGPGAKIVRGDGESGAIWLTDPALAQEAAERVVALHPSHVEAVFYRSRVGADYSYVRVSPDSWMVGANVGEAYKSLVETAAGPNGPDVWVLFRENYTVVPKNVAGVWRGTHGGPSWKVQHIPLILAGPGIRGGIRSSFPARSIDIAPTIERLLGLPAIHSDGVILGDALQNASKWELQPEASIAPVLKLRVSALEKQSKIDVQTQHTWPQVPPAATHCRVTKGKLVCTSPPVSPTDS
jgi:hypothetical protein